MVRVPVHVGPVEACCGHSPETIYGVLLEAESLTGIWNLPSRLEWLCVNPMSPRLCLPSAGILKAFHHSRAMGLRLGPTRFHSKDAIH